MEWIPIIVQILGAVGSFIGEAIQAGNVDAALSRPLSEILPHELRTTIAKKIADDAAAKKFGAST